MRRRPCHGTEGRGQYRLAGEVGGDQILSFGWEFEAEESAGVAVADVADHVSDERFVVGQFTFLHILAKEIAENAAEVLVARVGHEGAGIGDHSYEARK